MRELNQMTITDAVKESFGHHSNERLRFILDRLVEHLHDFVRETELTQDEWMRGLTFLYDCGQISNPKRHEFILLSDVLGFSALVDMVNTRGGGTEGSNLGPFYLDNAPVMALGADLAPGRSGVALLVSGTVRDTLGHPIPGAIVDTWQADAAGQYPVQDPKQNDMDLRAQFKTDSQGRYYYTTVQPQPYTVPYDGPVGALLKAAGRHAWRTKHLHFIVRAPGMRAITTEMFFEGDQYLESDAVFGVRKTLVVKAQRLPANAELPFTLKRKPDAQVQFDIVLAPGN